MHTGKLEASNPLMKASRLMLRFTSQNGGELIQTAFENARSGRTFVAARGRRLSATEGSFRWSPGVKALSLFFLRYKLLHSRLNGGQRRIDDVAVLSGEEGSAAASLDYAISKEPAWLMDMFGPAHNASYVAFRQCVTRANPERKRPGPVKLFPVSRILSPENILVHIDGKPCEDDAEIKGLLLGIQGASFPADEVGQEPQQGGDIQTNLLKTIFREECLRVLSDLSIFSKPSNLATLQSINNHGMFQRVAGGAKVDCLPDLRLSWGSRRGLLPEHSVGIQRVVRDDEICIAIDAVSVPIIVLFKYLTSHRNLPIRLSYNFADTTEMVHYLMRGGFPSKIDGMVVSAAASATLLGKVTQNEYHSVMLLPKVTHKLVTAAGQGMKKRPPLESVSYLLMNDIPGTSRFFLENLLEARSMKMQGVRELHHDPDEIFAMLRSGSESISTVMFFPHYKINELLNHSVSYETPKEVSEGVDHVLFLHREYHNSHLAELLNIELRHAWLTIVRNPQVLDQLLDGLFEDEGYVTMLKTCCGLN